MGFQRRAASRGQQPNRVLMPGVPRDARWVSDPARFGVDARVPIEDFQANIGAMIERAEKQGAKVVLANTTFAPCFSARSIIAPMLA